MKSIPDKSIDMILCDLPYWTTACKWDTIIPFEPLWEQYKRIIKDNWAIVLFGSEPFSSHLRMSNLKMYKYDWIWEKTRAWWFAHSKNKPMKKHENISVFSFWSTAHKSLSNKRMQYHPQWLIEWTFLRKQKAEKRNSDTFFWNRPSNKDEFISNFRNYPDTILKFSNKNAGSLHPTQKPVALFEYLIKTYTQEWDTVLDNCAGSWTTWVACINTGRNYILIEKDELYCDIIRKRLTL